MHKCKPFDVATLVSMMDTVTSNQVPNMRGDRKRTTDFIKRIMTSNTALVLVSDDGFLIALESPFIWFEKRYTQIIVAGAETNETCAELVGECVEWWLERKGSMLITYSAPTTSQIDRCLLWHKFTNDGSMFVRRRYQNGLQSK